MVLRLTDQQRRLVEKQARTDGLVCEECGSPALRARDEAVEHLAGRLRVYLDCVVDHDHASGVSEDFDVEGSEGRMGIG